MGTSRGRWGRAVFGTCAVLFAVNGRGDGRERLPSQSSPRSSGSFAKTVLCSGWDLFLPEIQMFLLSYKISLKLNQRFTVTRDCQG